LDLIRVINPKSNGGHKFILVAIEYFIKWVEAIPLRSSKGPQIVKSMTENIIDRFDIPSPTIMDNKNNFRIK